MGSLKEVSTPTLVLISQTWLDPTKDRKKIEALNSGPLLIDKIQAAHDGLLTTQRQLTATAKRILEIQAKQTEIDATRHDPLVRGICWVMTGFAEITADPAEKKAILDARDELFPDGLAAVRPSYKDEAGFVILTEARLTEPTKALLKKLPIPGGKVWNAVQSWFDAGHELGQLDDEKRRLEASIGGSSATPGDALKARSAWINVARLLEVQLEFEGASEEVVEALLGPVREAEKAAERAAARRASRADAAEGEDAVDPSANANKEAAAPPAAPKPAPKDAAGGAVKPTDGDTKP